MIARDMIIGVVLAGGRSSRFGSNKALYVHNGQSLLSLAIQLLSPLCSKVYISGECTEYQSLQVACIPDLITDIGPLGGIYSAMKQVSSPYYLIISCDMPYMTSAYAHQLLSVSPDTQITYWKESDQTLQLFPLLISRSLLPAIQQKIDNKSYNLRSLINDSVSHAFPISPLHNTYFTNINYRSDIEG